MELHKDSLIDPAIRVSIRLFAHELEVTTTDVCKPVSSKTKWYSGDLPYADPASDKLRYYANGPEWS